MESDCAPSEPDGGINDGGGSPAGGGGGLSTFLGCDPKTTVDGEIFLGGWIQDAPEIEFLPRNVLSVPSVGTGCNISLPSSPSSEAIFAVCGGPHRLKNPIPNSSTSRGCYYLCKIIEQSESTREYCVSNA